MIGKSAQLGKLVEIKGGGTPSRKVSGYWNGGIPWATVKDLKGHELSRTQEYISEEGLANSATNLIPAGTVVVGTRMAVGKAVMTTCKTAINQDLKALYCGPNLDTRYLLHFITSKRDQIERLASGATVKGIKLEVLRDLLIPLPPLAEQKRIAAILDKADELRRKRRETIAKLDTLIQSIFLDMFGDPVTNPKGWEMKKLSKIGTLERGRSKHRPRNAPELLGGPHPLIQTGDVSNASGYITEHTQTYSDLGLQQSRMWPSGTLCITIAANIAKTAIMTFDACFPDSVVGFTPNADTTTEYVQCWFSFFQKMLEDAAPESAQKNINLEILRKLDVPMPPREQQDAFTKRVDQILKQKRNIKKHSEHMSALFTSIQKQCFQGGWTNE